MNTPSPLTRDFLASSAHATHFSRHTVAPRPVFRPPHPSTAESSRATTDSRFAGLPLFVVIFTWTIALVIAHLAAPGMHAFVRAHSVVLQPAPIAAPIDWSLFSALPPR